MGGTCGANSACGTYATTLWYADDLAQRAKHGFVQYQRQDLFGGYYGLTNSPSAQQALAAEEAVILRPDYWVNFMWKRCLGPNVLNATSSDQNIRAYAFNGAPPSPFAAAECRMAPLQLLLINLSDKEVRANVNVGRNYSVWTLTPPAGGPFAEQVELNSSLLPTVVDTAQHDPIFLEEPPPATHKTGKGGVALPAISTTFLCMAEL